MKINKHINKSYMVKMQFQNVGSQYNTWSYFTICQIFLNWILMVGYYLSGNDICIHGAQQVHYHKAQWSELYTVGLIPLCLGALIHKQSHPNYCTTPRHNRMEPIQWILLYCAWDLIPTQHHHNNCTTLSHMGVGPHTLGPTPCDVVNLSFFIVLWSCAIVGVRLYFSHYPCALW
jgi:hypothetical protein